MKIFDWIHRKLHSDTNYSRVSYTEAPAFENDVVDLIDPAHRPPAAVGTEPDTETPLLLHVNLAGILTIGTLGYSHRLFLPHFSEEPKPELPEKEIQAAVTKPPPQIALLQPATDLFMIKTEQAAVVEIHVSEDQKTISEPLLKEDRERKERTTLADLLAVELASNGGDEPPPAAGQTETPPASDLESEGKEKKKKAKRKKKENGSESSQSLNPAAAERIRRVITRMVKKKIHPEAAAAGRKGRGAADVAADLLLHGGFGGCGGGGGAA